MLLTQQIIDIKDKFKIWRRDLGDTMINPYYVLGQEMLAILLDHSVYIIDQWTCIPSPSQVSFSFYYIIFLCQMSDPTHPYTYTTSST